MTTSMQGNSGMRGPSGSASGQNVAGYNVAQLSNFSPEQMQLFQQLFSNVGPNSYLSKLAQGDQSTFEQMEAPAHRQFQGLQGELASRFSGMGLGGRRGSGFQMAANQQTSDFAQDLQSRRQQIQQQAIQELMGISNQLLGQRPYENFLIKPNKQRSAWESILAGGAPIAGGAIGGLIGGPAGAAAGAGIGSSFASGILGQEGQQQDWSRISQLPNQWGQ